MFLQPTSPDITIEAEIETDDEPSGPEIIIYVTVDDDESINEYNPEEHPTNEVQSTAIDLDRVIQELPGYGKVSISCLLQT